MIKNTCKDSCSQAIPPLTNDSLRSLSTSIFQKGMPSRRTDTNFTVALFRLPSRYRFSSEPYFEYFRTDIGNFQEGISLQKRYFSNRSSDRFSLNRT